MIRLILSSLLILLGISLCVIPYLIEKENKKSCSENKHIKQYSGIALVLGSLVTSLSIVLVIMCYYKSNNQTHFSPK